jgi:choloylglycine hydrolase
MKMLSKCLLPILSGLMIASPLFACTDISIKAKDGSVIVARTMEFAPLLDSAIVTSPRGTVFKNTAPNGKQSYRWTGKYGFVYMNFFHINYPVDGMNEKGLSFGGLYLPGETKYQTLTKKNLKRAIPYFQVGAWILSNFKTVDEVKAALPKMTIFEQGLPIPGHAGAVFPLHITVTDASGKSIVVEWINGKEYIYDNNILGVLTNDPIFPWQVTNLKNYANLSPYTPVPIKEKTFTYSATGQGAGMVGLPGDISPPSRFVKMVFSTKMAVQPTNAKAATILADHIIGTVFIPIGLVRASKSAGLAGYEQTQWTVLKDLKNHILYFKTYNQPMLQSIDLNKLNFAKGSAVLSIPMTTPAPFSMDITQSYKTKKS